MKLKSIIKKGFTLMELAIVIGVIAVLTATSVGLYFGLSEKEPDKEAVSIQDKVIALWNSHINNGLNYATGLDGKANEFCTGYVKEKGVDVDLNYRVLEFENSVSTILPESGNAKNIQRAYDPSNDNKYAVVIKVESAYPTYFISSTTSVLETSVPFETEDLLLSDLYDNVFIQESGILEKYNITSPFDRFNEIFELDNIVVDGKIVRGIKYIRYNVTNESGNYYSTLYCRENRTLNDDCAGEYHPKYSEIAAGNGTLILNDQFRMVEKRSDEQFYNYDPDRVYSTEKNTHMSELETYDVLDKDGNVIETKKAPISSKKYQYIIDEKDISYVSFLQGGSSDPSLDGSVGEDGNIDLTNPVNPDIFDNPGNSGGTGGGNVSVDDGNLNIEEFPIVLFFTHEVDYTTGSGSFLTDLYNLIRKLFGITQTKFQYLFFNSFKTLNEFINLAGFKDLLKTADQMSYIYITGSLTLDVDLNIPENFAFVIDHRTSTNNTQRKEYISEFVKRHQKNESNVASLDRFYMGDTNKPEYEVSWGTLGNELIVTSEGSLKFHKISSYLFVEGDINAATEGHGYEIAQYGRLMLEKGAAVTFKEHTGARFIGRVEGEGRVVAYKGATISEPFKITDYMGEGNSNAGFVKRDVFPSDFYYLDSIRAQLIINYGAHYIGLIAIHRDIALLKYTFFEEFYIASSNTSQTLFTLNSGAVLLKSCDENGKSKLEFSNGLISYNYTTIDIDTKADNVSGSNLLTASAMNEFSTAYTGIKLSNMDLIFSNKATFDMGSLDSNGKIEVLPGSSIQFTTYSKLKVTNDNKLIIANYYQYDEANQTKAYYDYILGTVDGKFEERQVRLYDIYHANNNPMIIIDKESHASVEVDNEFKAEKAVLKSKTPSKTKDKCSLVYNKYAIEDVDDRWWVTTLEYVAYPTVCDKTVEYTSDITYKYDYANSSIFTWTLEKTIGLDVYKYAYDTKYASQTEQIQVEDTHWEDGAKNGLKTHKVTRIRTHHIYLEYNTFVYVYGGTSDSCQGVTFIEME